MSSKKHTASSDFLLKSETPTPVRLQFGLNHGLAVMTLLSIVFAVIFAMPSWVASATVMIGSLLIAAACAAAIVYGRGYVRAFYIGAMFPLVPIAIATGSCFFIVAFEAVRDGFQDIVPCLEDMATGLKFAMVVGCVLTPVAGVLGVRRCVMYR